MRTKLAEGKWLVIGINFYSKPFLFIFYAIILINIFRQLQHLLVKIYQIKSIFELN